ncbi:MAG: O-acetylhomoserine aminocarboxypropyltransferase [Pseudomonadota bacterium]|nr:O-acetylhomoserine aminocarboxypropyltransferase [Pseudomonadota bacterium]
MTTKPKTHRFDTLSLHAGSRPDPATGARATPIYQTSSFVFPDTDHAAALFNMERAGHVYSRLSNPTCAVLEERIAALEGGIGAIATASGQAALHLAIVTLLSAGSHIVASRSLYGGSHNLLDYTLPRFGIDTTFVDTRDVDAWRRAIRPETRLLFGETLGNPGLEVLDIPCVAVLAHEHGLPLLVDSTFTTPWLMRPFDYGADLVYHSATKFLSGHGTVIGGLLVDGGQFDWNAANAREKFPTLTTPYAGFHDMVFAEESTTGAFLLRARREGVRDFGACMAPMTAFHILQGIETLPVRMARHVENTRAIVAFLRAQPFVAEIAYPELPDHPDHALAARLLPRGCGAVFSFNLRGTREQGRRFIEALRLFSHLANVGDAKSLVIHPASTTHFRMSADDLLRAGITEGTIRLSIGLEDPADLIEDLSRALYAAGKA